MLPVHACAFVVRRGSLHGYMIFARMFDFSLSLELLNRVFSKRLVYPYVIKTNTKEFPPFEAHTSAIAFAVSDAVIREEVSVRFLRSLHYETGIDLQQNFATYQVFHCRER